MVSFLAWVIAADSDPNRITSVTTGFLEGEVIAALPSATYNEAEANAALRAVAQAIMFSGAREDILDFARPDAYILGSDGIWDALHPYLSVHKAASLQMEDGRVFFSPAPPDANRRRRQN